MKIRAFRNDFGGLLGESNRKNLSQIADNNIDVTYHKLHHLLTESTWDYKKINEQRLKIISSTRQTKIGRYISLIIDDLGHRKNGNVTEKDTVGLVFV